MAVAFDAKATTDTSLSPALTVSSPVTVTTLTIGGTATALLATVTMASAATPLPVCTGVTWNGVAMTQLATKVQSDGIGAVYMFGLGSPATGNHTLSVSFTGTNSGSTVACHCASFTGTDTSTANAFPVANIVTDATNSIGTTYPTGSGFSVTTTSGDLVVATMSDNVNDYTTLTAGTIIFHDSSFNNGLLFWGYNAAVGSTTTFQFSGGTGSPGTPCCGIAVDVAQPAGGALTLNMQQRIMM